MANQRTPHGRRSERDLQLERQSAETIRGLGASVRAARRRRRLTQSQLAGRAGLSRASLSRIETGRGGGVPVGTWLALAAELGLAPRFGFARDWREEPVDAGHLAVQELLLRLGRAAGYTRTFELPIGRARSGASVDVFLRDDRRRRLVIAEVWNVIGDIGAGSRSFDRKLGAAAEFAVAITDEPYSVHGVWVIRATRRNRALVARYPEVFATAFKGSSRAWAEALVSGGPPPDEPGLVWADVAATRIFAWRRG
ncbi:MAG TPA: helix-turn-helix transcriptional regulator [Candidatus Sulfomarinibacteraceae bacterium]|nr:helix-turn-helix transcriptional regulator [Candidatus Sulfomarinibacteraceae bacterium]